ncbi:uncharacterized mitochondrial protein AtMg00860-like [Macadamia integrifolia]|uniref:uncharacterized mitochondrial protein AtMg00860-like n=1 Tax=Macadamia integrifolia TaxID=60698 RepID=UPI001C4EED8C|nr:uncharacterized mitochondrial protein AtMg00860-like [Macadamia integrifolia]
MTLAILRSHQLFVKMEKCSFGEQEVKYLGHVINHEGVAVDPEKISIMIEWPKPSTLKTLRGFWGLTRYYRKFIQNYDKIAPSLTNMLKRGCFKWNTCSEAAFEELNKAMTRAPVLALPDFSKTFIIECDAVGSGVGGVLMQEKRLIAFFSHSLKGKN